MSRQSLRTSLAATVAGLLSAMPVVGLLSAMPGAADTGSSASRPAASGAQPTHAETARSPEPMPADAASTPERKPVDAASLDERIETLTLALRADRNQVAAKISEPRSEADPPLSQTPEFRELAEHLVGLELQLKELQQRKAALGASVSGAAPDPARP